MNDLCVGVWWKERSDQDNKQPQTGRQHYKPMLVDAGDEIE